MSCGLKNARAIYQILVNKISYGQIRKNMEVYVNEMLIKHKKIEDHVTNLE